MTLLHFLLAVPLTLLLACRVPRLGEGLARRVRAAVRPVARRTWLACAAVGLASLLATASLGHFLYLRPPAVHDEFAYLLSAETFAAGRAANPTHPLWQHFETYHVFHEPTYQAKYPPGQGLVLAAGILLGHPLYGVWFSLAAASAATCWMLRGFLPPHWALGGGLIAALHVPLWQEWGHSYWGGAVAMAGGAVVLGAVPRLARRPNVPVALALGIGLVVLANTRPLEGLLVAGLAGLGLAVGLARQRPGWPAVLGRIVLPVTGVLLAGAAAMAWYNCRLTGSPWLLPYQHYTDALFGAWSRHKDMTKYRGADKGDFAAKAWLLWQFFWNLPLTWPLLGLPCLLRRARGAWLAAIVAAVVGQSLLFSKAHPHYVAPAAGLIVALPLLCLRELGSWRTARGHAGRFLGRAFFVLWGLSLGLTLRHAGGLLENPIYAWAQQQRAPLVRRLLADPRPDLVIVRYGRAHNLHEEWVYNAADIDAAPIVWARDMGPGANARLLEYFAGRRAWLLEVDAVARREVPYPAASAVGQDGSP